MAQRESGTVTFLCTDIEGSTRLLKRLGRERYAHALADQQRIVREVLAEHGGEEVDTQGDSFLAAFRSAKDAVEAAIAVQRKLAVHRWPEGVQLRVRIGIHSGDTTVTGGRYVGLSVHRTARIAAAAHGGQVLLSSATRELVEDELSEGVFLDDLGVVQIKDFDRPEPITQVTAHGLQRQFPAVRSADGTRPTFIEVSPLLRIRWDVLARRFRALSRRDG